MAQRSMAPLLIAGSLALLVAGVFGYRTLLTWQQRQGAPPPAANPAPSAPPPGMVHDAQQWSLPADVGTMILVRHDDVRAVAETAAAYWLEKQGALLQIAVTTNMLQPDPGSRFFILDPHDGVVEIDGPVEWKDEQEQRLTAMAAFLSARLRTRAVAALVGPGALSGVVGIYEDGQQRFFLRRTLAGRDGAWEAVVHVDGVDWVREATPFQPASGHYQDVTMRDADRLVQALGLGVVGAPLPEQCLVLKEEL